MWGAVIGDIAGSRFEGSRGCPKSFELFHRRCTFTDDTVCTAAIAHIIVNDRNPAFTLQRWCRRHPDRGYGGYFRQWIESAVPIPYGSFGNGAAMRVSPVALVYRGRSLGEALAASDRVTDITHDHPEGIKGARAVTEAIWRALRGEEPETMCEIADRSIDSWPVDRSFPVHARLQDITLEVMLRVVFGVADETRLVRLGKAVVEALELWDVGNPLRPIKALWRFGRVRREIDALLLDEVRRRRAEGPEERTDIMSMLLAARDEDGSAMSDEEVRDEMFTMLVAGHETTATLVAWVIHRLLENLDVLEAARAEVASVVGSGPHPPAPAAEQIARLGYLDAVIKETARLHPVVPIVVRQLETDHVVGSATAVLKMRVDGRCEDVIFFDGVFFEPLLTSIFFAP